jgi:hypothetical protein
MSTAAAEFGEPVAAAVAHFSSYRGPNCARLAGGPYYSFPDDGTKYLSDEPIARTRSGASEMSCGSKLSRSGSKLESSEYSPMAPCASGYSEDDLDHE